MVRLFKISDMPAIMRIWRETNIQAHSFIPEKYWADNYDLVKDLLPQAEVYVFENEANHLIEGFIGINENHIVGIFVRGEVQSTGIGQQLIDYVKTIKKRLSLYVYVKNERAINFYLREHFLHESERIDESTGEKELFMIWKR